MHKDVDNVGKDKMDKDGAWRRKLLQQRLLQTSRSLMHLSQETQ